MKKSIFLFIFLYHTLSIALPQNIELTDHRKVAVVDNIEWEDAQSPLRITKRVYTEIIADVDYCGKSGLSETLAYYSNRKNKKLNKILGMSDTAYSLTQGETNMYVTSIWSAKLKCSKQKDAKLKVQILELLDEKNKTKFKLILLR